MSSDLKVYFLLTEASQISHNATVVNRCSLFPRIFHFRSLAAGFLDQELWFDQTSFTPLWRTMKVSVLLFCQCCIVFESLLNNDVCGNIKILYTEFIWIKHDESCVRVDIHSLLTLYLGFPWVAITTVKGLSSHHNVTFKSLNLQTSVMERFLMSYLLS